MCRQNCDLISFGYVLTISKHFFLWCTVLFLLINNNLLDYFFSHKNTKLDLCEIVLSPNGTLTFSKYHVKYTSYIWYGTFWQIWKYYVKLKKKYPTLIHLGPLKLPNHLWLDNKRCSEGYLSAFYSFNVRQATSISTPWSLFSKKALKTVFGALLAVVFLQFLRRKHLYVCPYDRSLMAVSLKISISVNNKK